MRKSVTELSSFYCNNIEKPASVVVEYETYAKLNSSTGVQDPTENGL